MTPHLCIMGDANSVHVRRWAEEMLSRDFRVSLLTARPEPMAGVEQRVLSPIRRSTDWLFRIGEARRHVVELAPDIVHAHYITSYGYLAARCGHRPLAMTAWGSDILLTPHENLFKRWLTGWTLRRADLVTGDSQDLIEGIAEYSPRAPLEQIHWGADMFRFRPVRWSEKCGFQVVSLRAWEPNYRIDKIIEGVGLFARRRPGARVHLHLLGGGSLEVALRVQVKSLGIEDRVTFRGRVGDAEMIAALQQCKVSISLPASDATSVSVLESMACGLPVIASDLPANRQWLCGDSGLLLAQVSAEAVAAALEDLWRDDIRAERIGDDNHVRMQKEGARFVQMDRMATLYHALLSTDLGKASSV